MPSRASRDFEYALLETLLRRTVPLRCAAATKSGDQCRSVCAWNAQNEQVRDVAAYTLKKIDKALGR